MAIEIDAALVLNALLNHDIELVREAAKATYWRAVADQASNQLAQATVLVPDGEDAPPSDVGDATTE